MADLAEQHVPNDVPRMVNVDICGVSGRFPESSSASEFYQNLISGMDMVTEDERKWKHVMHEDMPKRCGKLKEGELASFDAQFFGMHGQQAKKTDPQLYKLLEVSYEAWTDSGIDVRGLRDSNRVGVYTGLCGSEVHGMYVNKKHAVTGYEQTGCVMSMMANRLSYFYSFRGPSKTCDTACSSAAMSLHDAIADISAGRTDYAVVLGSCHMLAPNMTLAFNRLHMLSPEGACKAFDAAGNGYVRSEGIAAIVLKRTNLPSVPRWAAVSPYCTVLNIGINNDGYTKEGITFPSRHAQLALEKQVCNTAGINPAEIYYVEAHGTGTVAGDGQELDAINKWYGTAPGRKDPLWIGSVKSNMGHCEGCSCLASVIKLCLSFEYGVMPGQLHFHPDAPNPDSIGLKEGTLQVMQESTPINDGLVALSSFGFGGANMHMVMQAFCGDRMQLLSDSSSEDSQSVDTPTDNIIPLASRTADGLAYLAKIVNEAEEVDGLSFAQPLRRYANSVGTDTKLGYRGTLINGELKAGSNIGNAPEVWFAFSGNGSQWPQMGLDLIKTNSVFQRAIKKCHDVLKPHDIDLLAEFEASRGFKTPLLNSVGLIAVQIGLTDVLREDYGIVPDGMLGHSAGEIACTYASGCCTAEQAVLIAYHRGRLPMKHGISTGLMAATGLSAEEARERCEGTKVVLACDNSPNSTTISGPAEDVKALVKELDAENIFARALDTSGVPYHSAQLDPLLPELTKSLKEVIPNPKERPAGWVSAAFPLDSTLPEANKCSPGYQVHSYRNPVLFNDAAQAIPKDALLVEVGPHSVLRSPLRQARPDLGYTNAMRKGEQATDSLATCVGDLWRKGVPVNWSTDKLPQNSAGSEVPRSIREALVAWDRTLYDVPIVTYPTEPGFIYEKVYDLGGDDAYICDHLIDNNVFIPLSCFLVTAWEAFAKQYEQSIWDTPVEFSDVQVYQPVSVDKGDKVQLNVAWDFSGHWQVVHEKNVICEGNLKIYDAELQLPKELEVAPDCKIMTKPSKDSLGGIDPETYDHITGEHWYAICLRQSLQYGPKFQTVSKYAVDRTWCQVRWDKNWIIHLDGIFQREDRGADYHVHVAKGMRRLVICDTMKDVEPGYLEHFESDVFMKYTRGRSIILQNYLDEIATQKGKAAKTLVHKMEFLPYGLRTDTDEKRTAYTQKLMSVVKTLFQKLPGDDSTLLKIKSAVNKLPGKIMGNSALEAFSSDEKNLLAAIFLDAYGDEEGPAVNIISEHTGLGKALEEDLFLNGFSQSQFDAVLGVAISNMKTAGYSVVEIGSGTGSFTKKTLQSFITTPQSALLSYTATDKGSSSDIAKTVPHSSLSYEAWDLDKDTEILDSYNIVVASSLSASVQDLPAALDALYASTLDGGFLFLQEFIGPLGTAIFGYDQGAFQHTDGRAFGPVTSIEHWQQLLSDAGFKEVAVVKDALGASALFLYRKVEAPSDKRILLEGAPINASDEQMDAWLKDYLETLDKADASRGEEPGTVWLYGDEHHQPGLLGFLTSARKEYKGDRLRAIAAWGEEGDIDYESLLEQASNLDLIANVFQQGVHGSYAPVQTQYKYLKDESQCPTGGHLNFETYGNLRSAVWRENAPYPDVPGLIRCNVAFGALNFRDVMLAYGKLSKQQMAHESGGDNIGFEFSGTEESTGKRVMGSAKNAMATKIVTRRDLTWEVPEAWSLAEAATVPTAYMTAYYALVMRGHLRKGHRVLIHSATGAVGLAAVQICLNRGAEVFVTVGTAEKRKFLQRTFPGLKADNIGDSRTLSFERMIKNRTRGQGVHLLLNSLAGDKLQASVRCLGNWGKLLEIGKYDILQGTPLSMRPMLNNISFEGIDVDRVMNHPDSTELAGLNQLVTDGIASGEVKPLPITVYNRTETEEAFRYLASGVHIGKVMIDVTDSPQPQETKNCLGAKPSNKPGSNGQQPEVILPPLKLEPALYFDPKKSYIVTGGLGGFGLAVVEFLHAYGAKNIVITSKRGIRDGNQQTHLMELHRHKINFRVTTLDVGVPEEADKIVKLAETLGPVGGIFHLAMYLADKLITNQTGESWNKVMHAKANGAWNLHHSTQHCKELDYFVMWSSFVASAGNEGQTNYGYANACLDGLSEARKAAGLPSLSIEWGVIDHVGVADKNIQELMAAGLLGASMAQPIDDCLKTLGKLMTAGPKQSAVMSSSWQPTDLLGKAAGGESKNILSTILTVMGLTPNEVNDADTLSRLGIDSMQLVEVRSNLQRALGRPLSLDDASGMSIKDIKAMEGDSEDAPSSQPDESSTPAQAEPVGPAKSTTAPIIHPSKIIDLTKDLCVRKKVKGRFTKDYTVKKIRPDKTPEPATPPYKASSSSGPSTPDKEDLSVRSPPNWERQISSANLNSIKSHRLVSASQTPSKDPPTSRGTPTTRGRSPAPLNLRRTPSASPHRSPTRARSQSASQANLASLKNLVASGGIDSEYPHTWEDLTNFGFFGTVVALILVFGWAISSLGFASKFGLVFSIPVVVAFYLLAGLGFSLVTIGLKRYLLPKITFGQPIQLFSPQFAAWWLVHRFIDINNLLFMRYFRGTVVLNYYYNLLGASIAESAFVDTLDVVDFDSLEIGEKASVGEGTTIVGHNFDTKGNLVFHKVRIGEGVRVNPYALITPETSLKNGEELKPLAKASAPLSKLEDGLGLQSAFRNIIDSPEFSVAQTTLLQVGGLVVPLVLSTISAYFGCASFEAILRFLGTPVSIPGGAYAAVAFVTLSNPFLTIFALMSIPAELISFNLTYLSASLAAFVALPLAFIVYAASLVILGSFAKHLLIGKIAPGIHKRTSKYGISYWVSQRLVDITFNNVGALVMGTWALNAIYRFFGADVGGYTVLRKTPAVTVPDMLKLGKWVVGGDTCKIATYMPLDSSRIISAPVSVGDQGTIGASAVLLPGTSTGNQNTVAPLTVPEAGSTLNAKTIYMGAPAHPVKVENRVDTSVEVALPLQIVALALPYVQIFGSLVFALASHYPSVIAGYFILAYNGGVAGKVLATYVAVALQSTVMMLVNNALQDAVGRVKVGPGPRQWSFQYFVASANAAVTFYNACFGESLWKGSPAWVRGLRKTGLQVGKWVYLDNEWLGEPGLIEYGDYSIADRGAILFGHLMTHNGKEFVLQFNKVTVGSGAVINARSALMPGIVVADGEQVPAGDLRISL